MTDPEATVAGSVPGFAPSPAEHSGPPGPSPSTTARGKRGSGGSPSGTLSPGEDFGPRYRIESVLGRGGMGAVYKAFDKELDRTVALKLVREDMISDPDVLRRFRQEMLLASKISHKNVLRIHDLGDVEGVKFISMAYVEGEDLNCELRREGRLPLDKAVSIATQLCSALAAAHAEGVIHRDLKPPNILIDRQGIAYVMDFGLAKSLEPGHSMMTHTGQVVGTPMYMSPEQVQGKPVDKRTDIYAFGLILYQMVTGRLPFQGDSALQVMFLRVQEPPKNPKLLDPSLPEYLANLILRCLDRDPESRYQTAEEILHDLRTRQASPASATAPSPLTLRRFAPWLWAAGLLAMLALLSLAIPAVRRLLFRSAAVPVETNRGTVAPTGIPPLSSGKYVAVLPFQVLGEQANLGYVAQGLQESLLAKLFSLGGVHVAPADAAGNIPPDQPFAESGRQLGANLIVHGVIQSGQGKIAAIVNLNDASSGRLLWTQEFSGVPEDLLTLEDQIFGKLVTALGIQQTSTEAARAVLHATQNVAAYDLYLKGRDAMRHQDDPISVQTAVADYQQAIQLDANFALAYAGLADASLSMYNFKRDRLWADKAISYAGRAREIDPDRPEVLFAVGSVYSATGRTAEAIDELKKAIQLSPQSDEGQRHLGDVYLSSGEIQQAIESYGKAARLDPYYWLNYNQLGIAYFQIGDYNKALAAFERITELDPKNLSGYINSGAIYLQQGKFAASMPFFQQAIEVRATFDAYSNLGTVYFYLKRYKDAVSMFEKAVASNPNQAMAVRNLADGLRWAGQTAKAADTYRKAIALAFQQLQVNPRMTEAMEVLALCYANEGDFQRSTQFMRQARAMDPKNIQYAYDDAIIQAMQGHVDAAIAALRKALQGGYPPAFAENQPEFDSLRRTNAYLQLIEATHAAPGRG